MYHLYKIKTIKAFSLLELLIVMGIIGSIMMLGIWGMLSLQRNTQLQQAATDVNAVLKETRSKAENNVFPFTFTDDLDSGVLYGYRIKFYDDIAGTSHLERRLCYKDTMGFGDPNWRCEIENEDTGEFYKEELKSEAVFSDIEYNVNVGGAPKCESILFINLTGDILVIDAAGYYSTTANCDILIKHKKSGSGIILHVYGETNKFLLEAV